MSTNKGNEVFVDQECRLVLIGKTGAGKSATGNTILGRKVFRDQVGLNSETKQCGKAAGVRGDLTIIVTDTPGLSDTDDEDNIIMDRITKSMMAARPGPHAILLVLRCDDRFTSTEMKVYRALQDILGQNMNDFLIIVFTGKDNTDNEKFEKQLAKADKLRVLLSENGNRYILFNNKATGAEQNEQVSNLLAMVKGVARNNERACFHFRLADQIESTVRKMALDQVMQWAETSAAPEPANTNSKNPGVTRPDSKNPGVTRPDSENPGVTPPGSKNPGVTRPDSKNPGVTRPDSKSPAGTPRPGSRIGQDLEAIGQYQSVSDRMKMFQQPKQTDDHQRPQKPASRPTSNLFQAQQDSSASPNPAIPTRATSTEEKALPRRAGELNPLVKQSSPTHETTRQTEIEQEVDAGQILVEELLTELQLREMLLARVLAIMSLTEVQSQQEEEECYLPYEMGVDPWQYSDMQLLECLMMSRVLNEEEQLSAGQMQLLNQTEQVVTEEVKKGMRKEEISEVSQLSKCIVM